MCCSSFRSFLMVLALVFAGVGAGAGYTKLSTENEFDKTTIDIGVVVSDLEKSSKFYTEAIGFTNPSSFDVPADFAKKAGLTDSHPLNIHVFQLGEGGTSLKLMEVEGVDSAKVDHSYISSSLGYSYLTIYIKSIDAAMKRLEAAGVKPIADGPVPIGDGSSMLMIVRDPDGNLIELIGPK